MFAAIVAIDAFSAIPFARLRKENRPIVFSFIKIINVIITLIAVLFLLKIAPEFMKKAMDGSEKFIIRIIELVIFLLQILLEALQHLLMLLPFIFKTKLVFDKAYMDTE